MIDLVFKFVTIGSVLTGGIAGYIAIRNNSRQVGAHIFLAYSDRIRNLRVTLGEPIGNVYPVQAGLKTGDRLILSGIQFLQEGVPVMPTEGPPPAHGGS